MVSTQQTLNQEWLHYVAQAAGINEITASEGDDLNIPGTLRKMLSDSVQIKTRNLFEVAGRYQLPPVRLDQNYFEKIFRYGRQKQWGSALLTNPRFWILQRLAQYYFEEFVPAHFTEALLKKVTVGGAKVGFVLKGPDRLGWILRSPSEAGGVIVEKLKPEDPGPDVCFRFSGKTMTQLIQCKLPLHRALLLREVEVEGSLLQALKLTNVVEQFLHDNPMDADSFAPPCKHSLID